MCAHRYDRRLPRSIRKHLRSEKARLRRELPPEEARRAIAHLLRGLRRAGEHQPVAPATDPGGTE